MAKPPTNGKRAAVDAVKHVGATRTNIPTAELESFAEANRDPKKLLYPRDTSLDPQLVWKGKDEQDRAGLAVPIVPIYIQESIAPRALIEDLRQRSDDAVGPNLFGDFNGLDFQQRVEFYQHDQRWTNRMILGDSLLVMASLAEKEGLKGKVQMIYVDPPYGIKFGSNWQVSTRKRDVRDGRAEDATRQPEQIRAFRDTWELGIDSYLAYMRDRLTLSSALLSDSGSVFVQIGLQNVHLVRSLMDEIFGSRNYVQEITYRTSAPLGSLLIPTISDVVLWYAKSRDSIKFRRIFVPRPTEDNAFFDRLEDEKGRVFRSDSRAGENIGARPFSNITLVAAGPNPSCVFPIDFQGRQWMPTSNRGWKTNQAGIERVKAAGRLFAGGSVLRYKVYSDDFPFKELTNIWLGLGGASEKTYAVQTSETVVQRCMLMTTDPGDLVLDPTCGSGTTAFVAEQWGRRWITVDTSRVALALARTRLMAAKYPYYILADSPEGIRREAEHGARVPPDPIPATSGDISRGFVYERVPHVTLKSIANNRDIHEGMTRDEIDAAIARHAESETLYDRPFEDKGTVRVSGPFTVESVSPHRPISSPTTNPGPETLPAADAGKFVERITDYLRKAGVQNTVRGERLNFQTLDSWPGAYIHAAGDYLEGSQSKRVAVCIGPEYGTVSGELIREAAKEASKFADLVVVCGFAFEANVGEETSKLGRLTIMQAKMNPDLSMGDELLKKTGAANLFMVFGEPDIVIRPEGADEFVAEIRGLDIYDPTTGAVKPHDVADIACWFVDTNYNEEAFFVRQAYFVGAGDPYEKLRRALKADIDPETWATLYRTVSRRFKRPTTGKIAVKVINHYGDEVLKAYSLDRGSSE